MLPLAEPFDATLLVHLLPHFLLLLLPQQLFFLCLIQGVHHLLVVFRCCLSIQYSVIVVIELTIVDHCEIVQNGGSQLVTRLSVLLT